MTQVITFLLVPGFSLLDFAAIAEPLRSANRLSGEALYDWRLVSQDGQPVQASNGMSMAVDGDLPDLVAGQTLFVVAAYDPLESVGEPLLRWLRCLDRQGVTLGGIDTGAQVLAEAGVLEGYRFTLHWEAMEAFEESYPCLPISQELFEIDRLRITSAGGTSSMDLMLELIGQRHGQELALRVAEQFVLGRIRPQQDLQRTRVEERYVLSNRHLLRVVELMRKHTAEPRTLQQLAEQVGITQRQLERLFREHLQQSPAAFYQELRLEKARQLLQQSTLSVMQVSLACGFASASYFARCYRQRFGRTPRQDRSISVGTTDYPAAPYAVD